MTPVDYKDGSWRLHNIAWFVFLATLLSALPLGALIAHVSTPERGAAFAYGADAATLIIGVVGLPYAVMLGIVLLFASFVPARMGWVPLTLSVIGLALPWLVVGAMVVDAQRDAPSDPVYYPNPCPSPCLPSGAD